MNSLTLRRLLAAATAALFAGSTLLADVVETRNGARLVGKITRITDGTLSIETDYAGTLAVKQSEVTGFSTDNPVAVRLASGTRFDGKVSSGPNGTLQVAGTDGTISTTVGKVAASWTAGGRDPEISALDRSWAYEAAMDINGKTGNKEQVGTSASIRATLKTKQDTLQFYTAYDRQVSDGAKSADQFKAGSDYQNNFSGKVSWYVRDEGGFDRVKDIDLYNIAAAGFGYDLIKAAKQTLTARGGFSFRYEGYKNPRTEDVKSAGLDFGFSHRLELPNGLLVNRLTLVPTFEDFSNYRANHESFYEMPVAASSWKLRLGLSNDYNSRPGRGVEKMDTTYFTRLVLNWR